MSVLVHEGLRSLNAWMERKEPNDVLQWAFRESGLRRIALTSAFHAEGTAVIHMAARIVPEGPILFLDTGFHFRETIEFKERLTEELNLNVIDLTGDYTVEEHEEPDCDRCCALNKTIPLHRALSAFDGWIASMRRDSSPSRSGSPILRYTNIDGQRILKVNPVATWSRDQVWGYLQDHRLPHHPLYDAGYASIGCAPCTRPTRGGEAERAGRWPGRQREECGIHSEESCRIPAESPDLGQH